MNYGGHAVRLKIDKRLISRDPALVLLYTPRDLISFNAFHCSASEWNACLNTFKRPERISEINTVIVRCVVVYFFFFFRTGNQP